MTESNKDMAVLFLQMASSGKVHEAYSKFVGPGFKHHNVHIFQFENGRIVELWDVGQPVPEESPNQYGMF